jgi:lipoprotein-anchoring transpeptidase ErfK/SrfK
MNELTLDPTRLLLRHYKPAISAVHRPNLKSSSPTLKKPEKLNHKWKPRLYLNKSTVMASIGLLLLEGATFLAIQQYNRAESYKNAYETAVVSYEKAAKSNALKNYMKPGFRKPALSSPAKQEREDADERVSGKSSKPQKAFLGRNADISSIISNLENEKDDYIFVIDKASQRAKLYKVKYSAVDEILVSTGINTGNKQREGDGKTPDGLFKIQSIERSSDWKFNGERAYGPYFLRLNCGAWDANGKYNPNGPSSIGIHGTNESEYLGRRKSHSCIRLANEVIANYVAQGYLRKGSSVIILGENDALRYSSEPSIIASSIRGLPSAVDNPRIRLESLVKYNSAAQLPQIHYEITVQKKHSTATPGIPELKKGGER